MTTFFASSISKIESKTENAFALRSLSLPFRSFSLVNAIHAMVVVRFEAADYDWWKVAWSHFPRDFRLLKWAVDFYLMWKTLIEKFN